MGKKAKEYKPGDFIFAKVKGYPAWPARVQRLNGKKYFVYFYGTGETANLAPNMIFDYAENKDKFLTKTVKRRDFNDGVKQIEHDFTNNVPLEQVISANAKMPAEGNDMADDSAINDTMDTTADTADDTAADTSANTTQDTVEDSDDAGALIIDEGKQGKAKKAKTEPTKTPAKETAKETPAKETPAKEAPAKLKTPRGRSKRDEAKDEKEEEEEKKEEEIVSRSGRKIRPKRYIDEQTEENTTLPSPHPKKRRANTPEKDKDSKEAPSKTEKDATHKEKAADKNIKHFNAVSQSDLEDLKEPFKPADPEKENILIACLPSGQYVGVKLFQTRPTSFRNDAARLQWDKQAAANALTLKMQLEKGQITPQSVVAQLVMDLNLTDEEKATLDKERETEEKRYRVQFLKTEMKLIELDAKIKTCLSLERADTELCLKLLDEIAELDVKPLMLLKHPTCLETVKRMRAYVGNTPSWDLSESDAIVFSKQAHRIRKHCDTLYKYMKDLFTTPDGLSFWEFFSERVLQFKKATAKLNADELLEMVHEPLEMSTPTSHTMKAAIDAANEEPQVEEEPVQKKKNTPAKAKKTATSTPAKPQLKRQSSRKQHSEPEEKTSEKDKQEPKIAEEKDKTPEKSEEKEPEKTPESAEVNDKEASDEKAAENDAKTNGQETDSSETVKENFEEATEKANEDMSVDGKETEDNQVQEESAKEKEDANEEEKEDTKKEQKEDAKKEQKEDAKKEQKEDAKKDQKEDKKKEHKEDSKKEHKEDSKKEHKEDSKKEQKEDSKKEQKEDAKKEEKEKEVDEPRAKRSRGESKKTEPPSKSPARRKVKA